MSKFNLGDVVKYNFSHYDIKRCLTFIGKIVAISQSSYTKADIYLVEPIEYNMLDEIFFKVDESNVHYWDQYNQDVKYVEDIIEKKVYGWVYETNERTLIKTSDEEDQGGLRYL